MSSSGSSLDAPLSGNGSATVVDYKELLKDRTAEGGAVKKRMSSSAGDTCTWYAGGECNRPRSCYDCLNTLVPGASCMINAYGTCTDMKHYDPKVDFRRPLPPNVGQSGPNQFPSANTSYCRADDQYCATCRKAWNNPFDENSQLSYMTFCRGVGGCVCIQSCESQYHDANVVAQRCFYDVNTPSVKTVYTSIGVMAALCLLFGIGTMVVRRWVRRTERDRPSQPRYAQPLRQREPTGPRLALSGWTTWREKLIESERIQLHEPAPVVTVVDTVEEAVTTPVATDYVQPPSPVEPPPQEPPQDPRESRARSVSDPTIRRSSRAVTEL